ncbi:MAG: tetratricopeptide repeat protein [Deltaproteobacteria bacterium]|nr:tetratricopeptide repeat protein [Deltaproteobacteria bacterium]
MGRRILLIDDDDGVSQIFTTIAAHLGYECSHAWDGREGVDLAIAVQPDIIFMDLMMPVMDGIAATLRIKELPFIAHIPIVVFTAALGDARIMDALNAGADDVLIKPVSMAQLQTTVRKHMGNLAIFHINRGLDAQRRGDLGGATASYDEAIRVNPDEAMAFNNRASVRREKGDLDGALADYNEAIRLRPDYAMAFNNRGVTRAAQGDLDGAIADYTEALRLRPDDVLALNNRGTARRYKGDINSALDDYAEALRLKPDLAEARNNRSAARQSEPKK